MSVFKLKVGKFKSHLSEGGLLYAIRKGFKYLFFLLRNSLRKKEPVFPPVYIGKTKLDCAKGRVDICWDGKALTHGSGLSVAVKTSGLWTDSSKADWSMVDDGPPGFKYRIVFRELPLSLFWHLEVERDGLIVWRLGLEAEEDICIDELRFACLLNPAYKSWLSDYRQDYFASLNESWRDLCLEDDPVIFVGARCSTNADNLVSFVFEDDAHGLSSLIQNPPASQGFRIIGLKKTYSGEESVFNKGAAHFFKFRIEVFPDETTLEEKVERARQEGFKKAMDEVAGRAGEKKKVTEPAPCDAEKGAPGGDNYPCLRGGQARFSGRAGMNILLVNLPWQKNGLPGVRAGSRWPHIKLEAENNYMPFPFFLAYATALLERGGFDVLIIDALAEQESEGAFFERISRMSIDYLVAETSIPSFAYDMALLEKAAESGVKIVLCGPNAEIYKPEFLESYPFISYVLRAEYEFTLLELMETLRLGGSLEGVKGLSYRSAGRIVSNPPREPFDINLLPWPHRASLPMHRYLDAPGGMLLPSAQMVASRGCPFGCSFCLWPQVMYHGRNYRARDVKDVVDEMSYLVREMGFKSIYFDDDTFNIGRDRMFEFAAALVDRGLDKTQWAIMARPDLMDEEMLDRLKAAGLWAIKYGVESADEHLVRNTGKNMDMDKALAMIRYTRKLGVRVHLTFTFGLTGETRNTIKRTVDLAKKLDPFSAQFSITTPFPGTSYYDLLQEKGGIVCEDLSSYDGNHKSVIRLDGLSARELEKAKEDACRAWSLHTKVRKIRI